MNHKKTHKRGGFTDVSGKTKHKRSIRRRSTRLKQECSPFARLHAVNGIPGCFTKNTIIQMKKAYNDQHPEQPVIEHDPIKIWNQLHVKIPQCDQESCWVEQIKDESLKQKLRNQLFVPKRPKKWATQPNAWLSNIDIMQVMSQYESAYPSFQFIDPTSIDFAMDAGTNEQATSSNQCIGPELCGLDLNQLQISGKSAVGTIINLDKHTGPGTHWVSIYVNISEQNPYFFYFDSTGDDASSEIINLYNRLVLTKPNLKYICSKIEHQKSNTECGVYSLVFIITMLTKQHPITNTTKTDAELIQEFTRKRIPDSVVEKYRHVYFR